MKNLTKQLRREWAAWQSFVHSIHGTTSKNTLVQFCDLAKPLHHKTRKQIHNIVSP